MQVFFEQSQSVQKQNYCNSKSPLRLSWKLLYQVIEKNFLSNTSILPMTRPYWPAPPVCFLWRYSNLKFNHLTFGYYDLIRNSPFLFLHVFQQISWENTVLHGDNSLQLLSVNILINQLLWRRANARNVIFFILYGGQFTLSTQLLTLIYLLFSQTLFCKLLWKS